MVARRFRRPEWRELTPRFGPNIHIRKVPSVVQRGAHYGAILLSARCHNLHQSAMNGHQTGHLLGFIRLFGGMTHHRVDFLRHHSDVPDLPRDTSIRCNTTARRSGGRLCGEATCPGISWSAMCPRRVSPWSRFSARGLFESRQRPHWSHASVNPDAVRHFEIPPNRRMNQICSTRLPG